ncbi:MAG: phosphatidylserine decarboxylase family protein [Bacteroidales bacterium]|nr:phosphatidylserine decarboxylase family protein [Bacteroidales bacterium]
MTRIDHNSFGTLAVVFIIAAIVMVLSYHFISAAWLKWAVIVFAWVFCIWQVFFFRVPEREAAGSGHLVASAADGIVVIVDECVEEEYLKVLCKRVCVYMDFFDVHANFWPVNGEVEYTKYHPGKHLLAFLPKSSTDNEHHSVCLRTPDGDKVFFKQIAGTFARRIVNYATDGLRVESGKQCGIIKFGSRVDYYLPLDTKINVKVGDKVRACESIIAELPHR